MIWEEEEEDNKEKSVTCELTVNILSIRIVVVLLQRQLLLGKFMLQVLRVVMGILIDRVG